MTTTNENAPSASAENASNKTKHHIASNKNEDLRVIRSRSILMNNHKHTKNGSSMSFIKDYDDHINRIKAKTVINRSRFADLIDDSGEEMIRRSFRRFSLSSTRNLGHDIETFDDADNASVHSSKLFFPRRESVKYRHSSVTIETITISSNDSDNDVDSLESIDGFVVNGEYDDKKMESKKECSHPKEKNKKERSRKKTTTNVSFSEVTVKEYPFTIGDNPGGSNGVPLSIDWEPVNTEVIEFEEFESVRSKDRRLYHQLKIPKDVRVQRLLDNGYNMTQITKAIKKVKGFKVKRLETKQFLYKAASEERNEKIRKKIKSLFTNYKKKERKYIEQSLLFEPKPQPNLVSSMTRGGTATSLAH